VTFDRHFDLKGTRGYHVNTNKVPQIILELGWGINGIYIGMGFSNWIIKSGSRSDYFQLA
jgi:hypothetical protein